VLHERAGLNRACANATRIFFQFWKWTRRDMQHWQVEKDQMAADAAAAAEAQQARFDEQLASLRASQYVVCPQRWQGDLPRS